MRRLICAALVLLCTAGGAGAQQVAPSFGPEPQDSTPRADGVQERSRGSLTLAAKLAMLRLTSPGLSVPAEDSFHRAPTTVPAGTTVVGSIGVSGAHLDVYGTVRGNAVAIDGDIRVHDGGVITGDAVAAGGRVLVQGGTIEGEMRSLRGRMWGGGAATATERPPLTTWQALRMVVAWFTILFVIGIGVMVFAEANLDGVVASVERSVVRAFWVGLFGQLLALPVLLVLCLALTITVIGILLVPFAIVAYTIVIAGLVTIGLLAVARLVGGVLSAGDGASVARGVHLRALLVGLLGFMTLWVVAALLTSQPAAGSVARGIAMAATWVAGTVGLGATLQSRAGTNRGKAAPRGVTAGDALSWQTPTPISGVAAARTTSPSARTRG